MKLIIVEPEITNSYTSPKKCIKIDKIKFFPNKVTLLERTKMPINYGRLLRLNGCFGWTRCSAFWHFNFPRLVYDFVLLLTYYFDYIGLKCLNRFWIVGVTSVLYCAQKNGQQVSNRSSMAANLHRQDHW